MQNLRCKKVTYSRFSGLHAVVTGGRTGLIPEWVSDKSMGCEVTIELPKKSYKDDNFLGFALFFHCDHFSPHGCEFWISKGDQFILVIAFSSFIFNLLFKNRREGVEALVVLFFPKIVIPNKYRFSRWKYFKACLKGNHRGKSVGMHLLYAQAQDDNKKISRNDKPVAEEESQSESESHHKRSRQHVF